MKLKAKSKITIPIFLGILFAISTLFSSNLFFHAGYNKFSSKFDQNFKIDYYNLKTLKTSGKVRIDDIDPSANWLIAKALGICTGNGTFSEPYVIKDLVIDGEGSGSCILIENSDVYFKIENCTLYSSRNWNDAGIELSYTNYGNLTHNYCSNNERGIYLANSLNNTISGNIAINNTVGITISNSHYSTISRNTANNNPIGMDIYDSDYNIILENTASNNYWIGIHLSDSNYNNISGNVMNECGLLLEDNLEMFTSLFIDTTNLVNGKPLYYYINEINLGPNNFTNAGQVILVKCNDSIISDLNTSTCSIGISLYYCNNNKVSGNTANNNYCGIKLNNSDYNNISRNIANNNLIGIFLFFSSDNIVSENTANNNSYGIHFIYSDYSNISGNIMNECGLLLDGNLEMFTSLIIDSTNLVNGKPLYYYVNEINLGPNNFTNAGQVILVKCNDSIISNLNTSNCHRGVSLYFCNNNELSGNTANNNFHGIYLFYSNNNTISENTVSHNFEDGIYLFYSNNNTISGNTANFNLYGIYLNYHCEDNTISGNTAILNSYGIYLNIYCDDNTISENSVSYNIEYGILLSYNDYNTISGNNATYNDHTGIGLSNSNHNIISGNTANNNYLGLNLSYYCDDNTISGNTANNNSRGIYLIDSDFNTITENIINYNDLTGIVLDTSFRNNIYLNCFINPINAYDNGLNNQWDYEGKGNYWIDYIGSDTNADGIGDIPYIIPGTAGSQDNFPLISYPFSAPDEEGIPIDLIINILIICLGAVIIVAIIVSNRRIKKRK